MITSRKIVICQRCAPLGRTGCGLMGRPSPGSAVGPCLVVQFGLFEGLMVVLKEKIKLKKKKPQTHNQTNKTLICHNSLLTCPVRMASAEKFTGTWSTPLVVPLWGWVTHHTSARVTNPTFPPTLGHW